VKLRECPLRCVVLIVQPKAPGGQQAERDDDRLVVRQHQRRQSVAGTDAVATADATLTLDGNPELFEGGDVAAHRPATDLEALADLASGDQRSFLEQLEERQQSRGRCQHLLK